MNIIEIIEKKKINKKLEKDEIEYFIKEYTNGNITDYQAAALIMAICINGMDQEEIANLTIAMANSGDTLDLSNISSNITDKHSTGGVGDKVTIILMPIIASLGIPVAKMSGRGLGITGGTVDKLESIPGYNTNLSIDDFEKNVKEIGISLISQTLNLAPADKKIYALRDAIGCTQSIPLIASSIMSKKIASGSNNIVIDVTVGKGAFMKDVKDAMQLARLMIDIGNLAGKKTICILTNMDEPLGYAVGNSLEIQEAIKCLKGDMPEDIKEVITTLGAYMISLAGLSRNLNKNKKMINDNIQNGKAYNKFLELVKKQGGDISYIENIEKFDKAKSIIPILSEKDGYIKKIDAGRVGSISVYLGAGRIRKEDCIDKNVGIVLTKKVGDKISVGEALAYIHCNDEKKVKGSVENLKDAFEITRWKVKRESNIIAIVE